MSTRGAMGIRIDGLDKISYNHFDSYPEGLGANIVNDLAKLLKELSLDGIRERARKIVLVDQDSKPTQEDVERFRQYSNLTVSNRSTDDWYCLLHELQGSLSATLEAGVVIDSHEFLQDSLFCEWAYVVNLDEMTFEVYRGFQRHNHDKGRYALGPLGNQEASGVQYYPVALIATFPLALVPEDWIDQVKALCAQSTSDPGG